MEFRADLSDISVKQVGDKEPIREITGYASVFGNIDSHGDVIDRGAFRDTIAAAKQRKVNLYSSHSLDAKDLLGSVVEMREDDIGLWFKADISEAPSAQDLAMKAQEGHLNEISIGFFVRDQEFKQNEMGQTIRHINEIDLVEISLVSRASNPKAKTLTVKQETTMSEENKNEIKNEEVKSDNGQMELLRKELAELKSELKKPVNKMPHVSEVEVLEAKEIAMDEKSAFKSFLGKEMGKSDYYVAAGLEAKALSSNVLGDGGALVPTSMADEILIKRDQINHAISRVDRMMVDGPIDLADFAFTGTLPKYDENGTIVQDNLSDQFGKNRLDAQMFRVILPLSERLVKRSAFDIQSLLVNRYSQIYANNLENHILKGTGSNEPLGIKTLLEDLGENTVNVAASAGLSNLDYDDMIDTIMALDPQYRQNLVILASKTAVTRMKKLKDSNSAPIWNNIVAGRPATFDGFPVLESLTLDSGETAGDVPIIVADLSMYKLAEEEGFSVRVLDQVFATTDQLGLKFGCAYDGMPADKNAFAMIKTT